MWADREAWSRADKALTWLENWLWIYFVGTPVSIAVFLLGYSLIIAPVFGWQDLTTLIFAVCALGLICLWVFMAMDFIRMVRASNMDSTSDH